MLLWGQDLLSYNREQATDLDDFNVVTSTMHHRNLSLNDAVGYLVEKTAELEAQYLRCHSEFDSFAERRGVTDETMAKIRRYLDHIGNMRRAHWCWGFECGRYFGERGAAYGKTRAVPLVPKVPRDKSLRENQVDVLFMEEELAKV